MKEANYNFFKHQDWMSQLGKSIFLVLFALCFSGLQSLDAQVEHPRGASKAKAYKIETCKDAKIQYTDDNTNDSSLYADDKEGKGVGRSDTLTICPQDQWHHVTVTFYDFDIHSSDVLEVFDGNAAAAGKWPATGSAPKLGAAKGTGASEAFGGWVSANCDPDINPGGCLTFVFITDGNNTKGLGWDAWVTCADRGIKVKTSVNSVKLACADATGTVTIKKPTVTSACGNIDPTMKLEVKNQIGDVCYMEMKKYSATADVILTDLGVGVYTAEWFLKNDKKKTSGKKLFSVSLPTLVCNDNVEIPLGAGCSLEISPDDVLESPCEPLPAHLSYRISVKFGSGNTTVITGSGSGAAGAPSSSSAWPIITKELLEKAGLTTCGATAEVTIERVYTPPSTATCNNGVVRQSCTTILSFKDQTSPIPQLSVDIDTFIACDEASLKAVLEKSISALDNCELDGDPTVSVTLEETDPCFSNNGTADTTKAFVVVTAVDKCGNIGILKDTFIILRPTEFVKPAPGKFECDQDNQTAPFPGLQVGYKKNGTGEFVLTDTITLSEDKYTCGYILNSKKVSVSRTDCGQKEFIIWSVVNWCSPETGLSVLDTQFIEYTDTKPPVFQDEESDQVIAAKDIELDAFECTYDITNNTKPSADDTCDDAPIVSLHKVFRIEDGKNWEIKDKTEWTKLDCDSFRLMYVVADHCHEQLVEDTTRQIVVIKDVTPPSAVCTDELIVSVPHDVGAKIEVKDIDAGSSDACGVINKKIRRKGTDDPWADYVIIICEDVHKEVLIEMRVWDKNNTNYNTCWVTITAEDKIPPICHDLEDKSIYCDAIHTGELGASTDVTDNGGDGDGYMEDSEWKPLIGDLLAEYNTRFGSPTCEDNLSCGDLTIEQEYQLIEDDCGALRAKRRYRAIDWKPNASAWAEQKITVTYKPNWELTFPKDIELDCKDRTIPPPATAAEVISNGSCDILALEVTADTFVVPGDVCMKIERTYEIINWCVYQPGDDATVIANNPLGTSINYEGNETIGRFTYTQVIKLYVTDAPVVTINDVETCIVGVGDALPYGTEDDTPGFAAYECDTIRTFSAIATNCLGATLSGGAFTWKITVDGVTQTGTGSSFSRVVSPKTQYIVEFWGSDGCGNSSGVTRTFEFWDCKKPTPYVLNGLAIELGSDGKGQMWATDLDQGSFDNCSPKDRLDLRIALGEPSAGPSTLEGVKELPKVISLDCDNVGTQSVSIYVIDEEYNWDVVGTYVIVQANNGSCTRVEEPEGMVAGRILNPNGENVEQVSVSVTGAELTSMTTGTDGQFQFNLGTGENYTVTPVKDMNPLNGVSTFDLVLISKHILGLTPFDSPYKYIAADVNKSGSITTFDMVQIRRLILNIITEFPQNDSWRFVDSKYDFTSANPASEDFGEVMNISDLSSNMTDIDFVGVKIGDVNGNSSANSLLGAEVRNTNGALTFNVTDRFVEAGQSVNVEFTSTDIASAQGYQFTLDFAGLEFAELVEGVAKAANFNTNLAQRGVLTTSWDGEATSDDVLFTLAFRVTTSGLLSDLISVSSDLTSAEAYNTSGELLDVNIEFTSETASANFELGQNTPNPFKGETVIGFNLPKAGTATLKVMDIQGKVLKQIEGEFAKGYNTVTINAKELSATGVLHYQLESADNVATKKMIIID